MSLLEHIRRRLDAMTSREEGSAWGEGEDATEEVNLSAAPLPPLRDDRRPEWKPRLCRKYLGDNDGTCPQLTCIRKAGHPGLCDNVIGDDEASA